MNRLNKKISIIIPGFNNEKFVREAIESALSQSYPNKEVIVIDDGSEDDSLKHIQSFGDRITWRSQLNSGAPAARNAGLKIAEGAYVKFLDADDVLLPGCLEEQAKQMAGIDPNEKAIVYGEAQWVNEAGTPIESYAIRGRQEMEDPVEHILSNCPLTSAPLHRKEYLDAIGGFDESLPKGQEFDLHLRLVLSGVSFIFFPGYVYKFRQYFSTGKISHLKLSKYGPLRFFNIFQRQQRLIEEQTAAPLSMPVKKILARRYWQYGRAMIREGFPREAKTYFKEANRLAGKDGIAGHILYQRAVGLVGPQLLEKLTGLFR